MKVCEVRWPRTRGLATGLRAGGTAKHRGWTGSGGGRLELLRRDRARADADLRAAQS